MILGLYFSDINNSAVELYSDFFHQGPLSELTESLSQGRIFISTTIILGFNLLIATFISAIFPSLIFPFIGIPIFLLKFILTGIALAPTTPEKAVILIPHSITIIVELQGYVIALLAIYIQGVSLLFPKSVGARSRIQGYWFGIKKSAVLYPLIILMLAFAAIYEAFESIYLIPILLK